MNAFLENADRVAQQLGVDPAVGLTDAQVEAHREKYGANAFTKEQPVSLWRRILEAASEPMLLILVLAAFITLGVNITRYFTGGEADFFECVGIFVAIGLSIAITIGMEGRSAKAFEALSKLSEDTMVRVLRGGETRLIPQKEVVVGDILCVETGDKLPADGRLLESTALMADESALTGESMPVRKSAHVICTNEQTPVAERSNMLYSGCFITGGSGRILVTAVGDGTEFGKIARELASTDKSTTPLQEKLAILGKRITMLGAAIAGFIFLYQVFRFVSTGTATLETIADAFITSIILVVAAVPEGLPTTMAISLAINIIKMTKQNALVKKMIACETVGCINVICSDKTGTLTENRMTVTDIYTDGHLLPPDQLPEGALRTNFCVNSTADVHFGEQAPSFIGNPTECALLVSAHKSGCTYQELRRQARVAHVFPFSSETKNMTTILEDGDLLTAYTKGSPEKILALCSMDLEQRMAAEEQIAQFQLKACRVIAFAHRSLPPVEDFEAARSQIERGMTFDGFVAITDPLRADVYTSVEHCRSAGIELKMLTGDNILTATAIANDLHLLDGGYLAVEARTIEEMSDQELAEKLPKIRVIARSTPTVKMRVVNTLKALGNVVAVTGDGINDAPAIKNADVGVAMGITGTEVSKAASDIILLDDSFTTIVRAVQWGRGIYENFQRFIQFQLTVNLSSVAVVLLSILSGFSAPFTALELLWINIIMDGPPALTLGLEPIRGDLMNHAPTKRDASIVTKDMLIRIVVNGVFISAVFLWQMWGNFLGGTQEQLSTILFTLFVLFQLFNAFNSRELGQTSILGNLTNNKAMLVIFAFTFALQVLITQYGANFFGTVPLPMDMWLKLIATALMVVPVSELTRLVLRSRQKQRA